MRFFVVILLCIVCVDSFAAPGVPGGGVDYDFIAEERWDDFGSDLDTQTWWGTTGGVTYSGIAICSAQYGGANEVQYEIDTTPGRYCWCKITSPFNGYYVRLMVEESGCAYYCNCAAENGDYLISEAGFMMTAESIMKFHNVLIQKPVWRCDVSLNLSTGVVYSLYLDKETSPALGVRNGEQVCWGKLEPGRVSPGLNIKYDGVVYHLVD